jgi:hypothetical protein
MNIPTNIRAGDEYEWTISNGDYPAGDGYAFNLYIRGTAKLDLAGVASGDDFIITLTSAQSATLVSGIYTLQGRFSKSGKSYTPSGYVQTIEVLPDISTQTAGYDGRSHARITLDRIESAIEKLSIEPTITVSIDGVSYQHTDLNRLFAMKKRYELEIRYEEDAERIAKGLGKKKILTRFDKTS